MEPPSLLPQKSQVPGEEIFSPFHAGIPENTDSGKKETNINIYVPLYRIVFGEIFPYQFPNLYPNPNPNPQSLFSLAGLLFSCREDWS